MKLAQRMLVHLILIIMAYTLLFESKGDVPAIADSLRIIFAEHAEDMQL